MLQHQTLTRLDVASICVPEPEAAGMGKRSKKRHLYKGLMWSRGSSLQCTWLLCLSITCHPLQLAECLTSFALCHSSARTTLDSAI